MTTTKPLAGLTRQISDGNGRGHWTDQRPFVELIEPFLAVCPGPPLAAWGLRLAALQRVEGIQGLQSTGVGGTGSNHRRNDGGPLYLRSVAGIANEVGVRPGYLTESALRRGYEYSKALRWIRFLHGRALYEQGIRSDNLARRVGFSDHAGWTRFVNALGGATPSQLPPLPLAAWVDRAIEETYERC